MKKLLIPIIFILSISSAFSQRYLDVRVWGYSSQFIAGDTAYIDIKFAYLRVDFTTKDSFNIRTSDNVILYQCSLFDMEKLKKQSNGTYRIKFICPPPFDRSGTNAQFWIKYCNTQVPANITTNILDEILKKELPNKYYDLLGNEVIPINEGVYICNGQKVFLKPLN